MGLLFPRIWTEWPPFYPDEFRVAADSILDALQTTRQDITFNTVKYIY